MIKVTDNYYRKLVVEILSQSFDDNKSVNYVIPQGNRRKNALIKLMEYSFDICLKFGEVWLSDDKKACSLVLFPDKKKDTFQTVLWDIKLALYIKAVKTLKREGKIKKHHPKEPFAYLWFVGVFPEAQNHGIGSKLLNRLVLV
ncbi:GNAT family N-acetyltransferase [Chondrinema litorale]|uniref:GNAT family N-acetyltransferase n=1 Tax=Chondrinema litorale TaxID=2994555 RepID=UPI002543EC27|nr:GNAT family N-acetyltransferase [Chondrinema litorale]UZR98459.1 GNAT family N-acetyltransferase [Chondrinema litorale]